MPCAPLDGNWHHKEEAKESNTSHNENKFFPFLDRLFVCR
jgi:hypothetical protein